MITHGVEPRGEARQELLFDPKIMRLPVRPETYAKAPPGIPDPFADPTFGAAVKFDVDLSERRYNLVNALFDQLVTFKLDRLKAATQAIHRAEAALATKPHPQAQALIDEARSLVAAMPLTEAEASAPMFSAVFAPSAPPAPVSATPPALVRQAQVEEQWASFAASNYAEAEAKAKRLSRNYIFDLKVAFRVCWR